MPKYKIFFLFIIFIAEFRQSTTDLDSNIINQKIV